VGIDYTSFGDGVNLLKNAVGQITFVFAVPITKPTLITVATAASAPAPMMSAAAAAALMSANPHFAARIIDEARIFGLAQQTTYDPQGEDEGKRKAPPESTTSNEPVAKMAKTGVANGDDVVEEVDETNANVTNNTVMREEVVDTTTMTPHAAYFAKLNAVAARYGPDTSTLLIRGIKRPDDYNDDDEEEEEDTSTYTAEQMSTYQEERG
jgi:hypothetical protein